MSYCTLGLRLLGLGLGAWGPGGCPVLCPFDAPAAAASNDGETPGKVIPSAETGCHPIVECSRGERGTGDMCCRIRSAPSQPKQKYVWKVQSNARAVPGLSNILGTGCRDHGGIHKGRTCRAPTQGGKKIAFGGGEEMAHFPNPPSPALLGRRAGMNSGRTEGDCGGCLYFLLVPGGIRMAQNHSFF